MKNKLPWHLISAKLKGEISPKQETLLKHWLNTGDNQQLFQQLESMWNNVQKKVAVYEPDLEYYWKEFSLRIQDTRKNNGHVAGKQTRQTILTPVLKIAAIITLLFTTTFFIAYYAGKSSSDQLQQYLTYSTLSSKSNFYLPDSTEVWLHNNTSLTYKYNNKTKQREVSILGEAYFNVRHDLQKPFIVMSDGMSVKVYGTQFNINAYPDNTQVLVSLYEGSVSMRTADEDVFLVPGEEGAYDVESRKIEVNKGDVEFAKIWTQDKIRFENKNLREVCKYLAKWYGVRFDISPEINDDQSYTFTFRGQSLDDVVGIMTSIQSFDYAINEENKTVQIKKQP